MKEYAPQKLAISTEEFEFGYEVYRKYPTIAAVSRALSISRTLAKKLIFEGQFGEPSYLERAQDQDAIARVDSQRKMREVHMAFIRESMDGMRKNMKAMLWLKNQKMQHMIQRAERGEMTDADWRSIPDPSLKEMRELVGLDGDISGREAPPQRVVHEVAVKRVGGVLSALPNDSRGEVIEMMKRKLDQRERESATDNEDA